jgi:hypothetical protein
MKPVKDSTLDQMEDATNVSIKAMLAYLTYQGENPMYEKKAKIAAALVNAFGRIRASESNRISVESTVARRVGSGSTDQRAIA